MNHCYLGDCRDVMRQLIAEGVKVQTIVTSPPYFGLRDYKLPPSDWPEITFVPVAGLPPMTVPAWSGCLGLEPDGWMFVAHMVDIFRAGRDLLADDGVAWINFGDSYASGKGSCYNPGGGDTSIGKERKEAGAHPLNRGNKSSLTAVGLKPKDLLGIPWRVALALQADGWYLRQDIIWAKPNPMPESVKGSHYSRHMVTIEEYENLSGMQYTDERAGDDWAGDMPSLSEREISSSKAPLSAKREGTSNSESQRRTRGCEREATPIQPVAAGVGQQSSLRKDGEGYQDAQGGYRPIQRNAQSENDSGTSPSTHENKSRAHSAEITCGVQLHQESKGQGPVEANVCTAQGRDSFDGQPSDSKRLGVDCGSQSWPVSLLRDASKTDVGSCDPVEQRRAAHEREYSPGVPAVQLQKEQQDTATALVGCPGCPKCIQYHGYIFHLSAGRCTKSHEYLFLLSKSPRYYFDAEAIKEDCVQNEMANGFRGGAYCNNATFDNTEGGKRTARGNLDYAKKQRKEFDSSQGGGGSSFVGHSGYFKADGTPICGSKRNKRSVWTIASQPYKEAHFATFPPALIDPCILAGSRPGDIVFDPFMGSGTVGQVAQQLGRRWLGAELNPDYIAMQAKRTRQAGMIFA